MRYHGMFISIYNSKGINIDIYDIYHTFRVYVHTLEKTKHTITSTQQIYITHDDHNSDP